jgi:hypothetical protein
MGTPPSPSTIARFSEAERQDIAREYLSGDRIEVVCKRHRASSMTIRYLLKEMGVPMRKRGEAASKDITGQRYGRLVAVRKTGRQIHGANVEWEFLCDCGCPVYSSVHAVSAGNTTSCGCYKKERITETQRLDLTGARMGSLTAVRFSHNNTKKNGNKGQALWVWSCDCGGEVIASGSGVRRRFERNGGVSCTKCAGRKRGDARSVDLTGKRFGMLTGVKQMDEEKSPAQARWLWQCDCGKTCERLATVVKKNPNANCGCSTKTTAADRTGERFGSLFALRSLGKREGETTYTWLFQCDCGNTCEARLRDAVSGLQKSCGCRQGGYDNIDSWLAGEFRNAEEDAYFYVFPLKHFPGFAKPGIAEDLETRRKGSRGEYGDVYDFIAAPRLEAWLLEQAVLRATRHAASCPNKLLESRWEGYTEVRKLEPDSLFSLAIELHAELQEMGREEFAVRHLVTTPVQRKSLRLAKGQQG